MSFRRLTISLVIPVHNEMEGINLILWELKTHDTVQLKEVIVVDSNGKSIAVVNGSLKQWSKLRLLESKQKGRAVQMNFGAAKAKGDILLFLHADCRLPRNALFLITDLMNDLRISAGAFDYVYTSTKIYFRVYAKVASLWARLIQSPLGDQGIFIRREAFEELHGYTDMPIFEEFDLIKRLKKKNLKIRFLDVAITTSTRRFDGCFIRRAFLNRFLTWMYYLGFDVNWLAGKYELKGRKD